MQAGPSPSPEVEFVATPASLQIMPPPETTGGRGLQLPNSQPPFELDLPSPVCRRSGGYRVVLEPNCRVQARPRASTHAIFELYPPRAFAGEVTSSSQSNSAIRGMVACKRHNGAYFWLEGSAACAAPCSAPCRPGAFARAVSNSFSARNLLNFSAVAALCWGFLTRLV